MPNGFSDEVIEHLGKTARTTIEMEQYLDFLRNRTFRRTLLCHADIEVNRSLSIRPLREFYVSSPAHTAQPKAELVAQGVEAFEGADDSLFKTNHPLTIAAFHYLIDLAPERIHFDALVRKAAARLNMTQITDQDAAALASNLLQAFCHSLDLIEFHAFAPQMTTVVTEHPLTAPLFRYQVRRRSHFGNLVHGRVSLDDFSRLVLAQLDGHNDRTALLDFLVHLVEEGKIKPPAGTETPQSPDEIRGNLAGELDGALQRLAYLALLVS
jgi:methyltransferase-like protein